jgi:hypothetical protein
MRAGASLGSHDTCDDYQLGYARSTDREYAAAGAVTLDSLIVLLTHVFVVCLPSVSPSLRFPHP